MPVKPAATVRRAAWALLVILAATTGCSGSLFRRGAADEDVDFARRYIALFQSRAYPAVEMGMDPALKDPQIRAKVVQMASLFPPGPPTAVRVVQSRAGVSGNTTTSAISFQFEYPGRWILAEVVIERKGQASVVKNVQVQPIKDSLDRLHRFTLAGKGPRHYAALAAAVAMLLFVFSTFLLAIRTPAPGMKWLWAIFVLLGVVRVAFNWTTGAWSINPLGMQLFGSGFTRASPFQPLILTTSLPVGAIVYLIQRHEWLHRDPEDAE